MTDVSPAAKVVEPTAESSSGSPTSVAVSSPNSSSSSGAKRKAEEPASPSMTKQAAAKALQSLKPPQKAASKKSTYVRFKALLLKDAKEKKDTETVENITKAAKDAWAKVKNLTNPPSDFASNYEDALRYWQLKQQAIKAEADEAAAYKAALVKYCQSFNDAAEASLKWAVMESTEENASQLRDAQDIITAKFRAVAWDRTVEITFRDALNEGLELLRSYDDVKAERDLIEKLRGAPDDVIIDHVKAHCKAMREIEELKTIKAKYDQIQARNQAEVDANRAVEERAISNAWSIKNEISSNLKKQMVYTNSNLKWSSKNISYKRGGVTEKVFAAAFDVPVGTKKATIDSDEVGQKWLRYGAYLGCTDVNVKLSGEELTATAKYSMHK